MTLEEIGETFDLTRERVRQIKEKAIRRLKHTSRSKNPKNLLRIGIHIDDFIQKNNYFKMNKHLIAPSILSADFSKLQSEIEMINNSDADWFHIDIMDGIFVPNISFGTPVMKAISKYIKTLDVHLMIVDPERYIEHFVNFGSDIITVHFEACNDLSLVIKKIKKFKVKVGVAINPDTEIKCTFQTISKILTWFV